MRLSAASDDFETRCRAILLALPTGSATSHATAGRLLGLPLPRRLDSRLDVIVPPGTRVRRAGVDAHRHTLHRRDIVIQDGIPVTSLERTFCDLSELLSVVELTVVGDHIARMLPIEALQRAHASQWARRGRVARRAALEMIDGRSESPKETELRLLLVDGGFGPFAVNHTIVDEFGAFLARLDLALPALRIAMEYEGDHHRERGQWRRDIGRRRRIEASGWTYLPVTQADLDDPRGLFTDLRRAIATRSLR